MTAARTSFEISDSTGVIVIIGAASYLVTCGKFEPLPLPRARAMPRPS